MGDIQEQLQGILRYLNAENVNAAKNILGLLPQLYDCSFENRILACLEIAAILASLAVPQYVLAVTVLRAVAAALLERNVKPSIVQTENSIENVLRRHECGNHVDLLKAVMAEVDSVMTRLKTDTSDDNRDPPSAQQVATNYNILTLSRLTASAAFFDRVGTTCSQEEAPVYFTLLKTIALVATRYLLFENLRITLIAAAQGSPGIRQQTLVWRRHLADTLNNMALVNEDKVHFAVYYVTSSSNVMLERFRQEVGCSEFLPNNIPLFTRKATIVSRAGVDLGDILSDPYIRERRFPFALNPAIRAAGLAATILAYGVTGVLVFRNSEPVKALWRITFAENGSYKLLRCCPHWLMAFIPALIMEPERLNGQFVFLKLIDGSTLIILDKLTNAFICKNYTASRQGNQAIPGDDGRWFIQEV
ncbi:uncharacterized protein LOC129581783 isoform X1 [Paramacrobiotus metropolitanus]|uniref:uncharacterized protein LOC129581783 isoform X1 n=1 Tax=Paramacrobiotus metropolitanus TaxID=2943436 RepID=UPI00244618AD|nr:uncharacterized protein LOC129581783 isoform X1 [Paramacrobiotus metropolitanus]